LYAQNNIRKSFYIRNQGIAVILHTKNSISHECFLLCFRALWGKKAS